MKSKIINALFVLLISISITACSNNKSSSNLDNNSDASNNESSDISISTSSSSTPINASSDSKIENTKAMLPSEIKNSSIYMEEISNILSTKNNNVIDTLGLSDSDLIESFNDSNFYVPVFRCEKLGILIGFNGARHDSIDKVRKEDETPIFIIPINETVIKLDNNINFRVGDNMKQFKVKFGEGKSSREGNLKGDKQFCFLTYDIRNLEIRFTSLDGDEFTKYDVYISKPK